jgi:uncharacterized protein YqgV (UPF0045/DUF77 family)
MRITAELSLYPLRGDYLPKIEAFIRAIRGVAGLEIEVNQISTQIRGECSVVFGAVQRALEASFADGGPEVLVAKFLNADLPIGQTPQVD